jgi:hypothetical protein
VPQYFLSGQCFLQSGPAGFVTTVLIYRRLAYAARNWRHFEVASSKFFFVTVIKETGADFHFDF